MVTPDIVEKVSLMEASSVNMDTNPWPPTEKPPKFRKATLSLIGRLRSVRRKSEASPIGNLHNCQDGSMISVNIDAFAPSFDEHLSDELSVKVYKDSIRFSLIENMKMLGSNVNCLFDIEKNGEVSAENITGKCQNLTSKEKNLVFLWACFLKRDDLIQCLYKMGADIYSTVPSEGFTSLHLAAFSGCVKSCKWLILNDLKVNFVVKKLSPLHCAVLGNSLGCTKLLLRRGATVGKTVLHCAVEANATDCLKYLLNENANVNAVDENGLTALHVAADRGMEKCLEIILSHSPKVDLNIQTVWRRSTALHLAAENGYFNCAKLLIDGGADAKVVNHKEQTALHLAAKAQSIECMEMLLAAGCDVDAKDVDSRTPLHAALVSNVAALHALEVLLKRGADVNIGDKFGYTPLHVAAIHELSQCVDCLIMNGADVTVRTYGGLSALSLIGRKTPDSINAICRKLDSSISMNDSEAAGREVDLKFDFRYLLQNSSAGEVGFLKALEEEGQKHMIEHPLCEAFLHLKWQKIRKFYFCRIFFSFVFVMLFSVYLLSAVAHGCHKAANNVSAEAIVCKNNNYTTGPNTSDNNFVVMFHNCAFGNNSTAADNDFVIPNKDFTNSTNSTDSTDGKDDTFFSFLKQVNSIKIMWVLLVIMAILKAIRKVISMLEQRSMKHYLYQLMNYFDWFVIGSVFLVYPLKWEKHVGALAVLFAWTDFMVKIGRLPVFGAYVAMFTKIQAEFFKLLSAYLCLLIGFTVAFCIVFSSETSFQNPLLGFVKILAMMTGDVDPEVLEKYYEKPFPIFASAYVTYTLITFFVTIVLMNLLVGIAVRDIQGLEKTAGLSKLIQQTELIYFLELALGRGYVPKRIVQLLRQLALVSPGAFRMVLHVKPLHPREKRLPKEVLLAAFNLARQKQKWKNSASCWSDTLRDDADCVPNQDDKNVSEELRQLKEMVQAQSALINKLMDSSRNKII